MNHAKSALLVGALTILASTLAFECAVSSQAVFAYRITFPALIAGLAGLGVWLTGCVLACRKASGPDLFGGGAALLLFLFVGGAIVEHFWPNVSNVHIGMGGLLAPMAACFLGGTMFILVGVFRVGSN